MSIGIQRRTLYVLSKTPKLILLVIVRTWSAPSDSCRFTAIPVFNSLLSNIRHGAPSRAYEPCPHRLKNGVQEQGEPEGRH